MSFEDNSHQQNIKIPNIYAPNTREPNFIKEVQVYLKSQVNLNTVIWWVTLRTNSHQRGVTQMKTNQRHSGVKESNTQLQNYIINIK